MTLLNQSKLFTKTLKSTKYKGSVRYLTSKQLVYKQFGDPVKVVEISECTIQPLGAQEVLVRMLAAPVNPVDMNIIQGRYAIKPQLPCIPGNEGVGTVEEVGKDVNEFQPGNKVIITQHSNGSWRNIAVFDKAALKCVPNQLGLAEAATLSINPCTAYRMLTDFKPVREKSLPVIQNGANSGCGQNVIQLCKAWGIDSINIVRNRPNISDLKKYLQNLGATYVLTEEEAKSTNIYKDKLVDRPTLGLNCVGGKNSSLVLKQLKNSGVMVTYGGMSREPVSVTTGSFIFKNLSVLGFWMTKWYEKANNSEKDKMLGEIVDLMCAEKLRAPIHKMVKFDNYKEALSNTLSSKGFSGCKYILDFT